MDLGFVFFAANSELLERRTAPITLAATAILSSFLCLIHSITDLKMNVSKDAWRPSRLRGLSSWSASIFDRNSPLSLTSVYIDAILWSTASLPSLRLCLSVIAQTRRYICTSNRADWIISVNKKSHRWRTFLAWRWVCGWKNFKHVSLIDLKISAVDAVHNDLEDVWWKAFIIQLDHFLVQLLHFICKHGVEVIAVRSEHIAVSGKGFFTDF